MAPSEKLPFSTVTLHHDPPPKHTRHQQRPYPPYSNTSGSSSGPRWSSDRTTRRSSLLRRLLRPVPLLLTATSIAVVLLFGLERWYSGARGGDARERMWATCGVDEPSCAQTLHDTQTGTATHAETISWGLAHGTGRTIDFGLSYTATSRLPSSNPASDDSDAPPSPLSSSPSPSSSDDDDDAPNITPDQNLIKRNIFCTTESPRGPISFWPLVLHLPDVHLIGDLKGAALGNETSRIRIECGLEFQAFVRVFARCAGSVRVMGRGGGVGAGPGTSATGDGADGKATDDEDAETRNATAPAVPARGDGRGRARCVGEVWREFRGKGLDVESVEPWKRLCRVDAGGEVNCLSEFGGVLLNVTALG